ncbi:hypothetical protein IEO21_10097 [Rhodonia placenta]|uniref:Uncharacterized protein n=1 Tax=Rhodonia placenta TaxID=104341 RepID=A0A8H7TXU9_9APHY|nr:hypothetical protein IEO21_10097 [Postia placenta]
MSVTADVEGSVSDDTLALMQGLQGDWDFLLLDLYWQQFEGGESWERQGGSVGMRIAMRGSCEVRVDVGPFRSLSRLPFVGEDEGGRTVGEVDVDEVLGVEGVGEALIGSHDGREEGKVHVLQKAMLN